MKVLKLNQGFFMWFGIRPIDNQTNHRKQLLHNLFGWLAASILGSITVSCSPCAINYGTNDLSNALYAVFPGIACFRLVISFVSMIAYRQKITFLFERLQIFYNESNF